MTFRAPIIRSTTFRGWNIAQPQLTIALGDFPERMYRCRICIDATALAAVAEGAGISNLHGWAICMMNFGRTQAVKLICWGQLVCTRSRKMSANRSKVRAGLEVNRTFFNRAGITNFHRLFVRDAGLWLKFMRITHFAKQYRSRKKKIQNPLDYVNKSDALPNTADA